MNRLLVFVFCSFGFAAFAGMRVELSPLPAVPTEGDNALTITLSDEKGQMIEGAKVSLSITMPAMGAMPAMHETAKISAKSAGHFLAEYSLAMSGSWEIELNVEKEGKKEIFNYSLTTGISGLTNKNAQTAELTEDNATLLPLGPERLQKIGVRFAAAKMMPLEKTIRAVGLVEADNTKKTEINLRYAGYVEKQIIGRVGDYVKAGAPLFTVYSPELVTAQGEFLLAHESGKGGDALSTSTKDRLKNLGLSEEEILRIKKQGKPQRSVTILAPHAGTLLEVNVREGSSFAQGQLLYALGDLSKNYIVARVFQRDLNNLSIKQNVSIIIPESGSSSLSGTIKLIYPNVNEGQGTVNVRIELAAPSQALPPGSYVDLRFPVDLGTRLVIPASAVLYSGLHKYVFIERGKGILEPKEITTGVITDDWVEITSGIEAGTPVVVSGTFLISSEAQLRSALPKWKTTH